jgi:hypothetical protein
MVKELIDTRRKKLVCDARPSFREAIEAPLEPETRNRKLVLNALDARPKSFVTLRA